MRAPETNPEQAQLFESTPEGQTLVERIDEESQKSPERMARKSPEEFARVQDEFNRINARFKQFNGGFEDFAEEYVSSRVDQARSKGGSRAQVAKRVKIAESSAPKDLADWQTFGGPDSQAITELLRKRGAAQVIEQAELPDSDEEAAHEQFQINRAVRNLERFVDEYLAVYPDTKQDLRDPDFLKARYERVRLATYEREREKSLLGSNSMPRKPDAKRELEEILQLPAELRQAA
jgi:hypothetical protein